MRAVSIDEDVLEVLCDEREGLYGVRMRMGRETRITRVRE